MIRRLSIDLDFGAGSTIAVGRMGWDAARRQAVVEWNDSFVARPLPISPILIRSHVGLFRPGSRGFGAVPALFGDSLPDGWGRLLVDRELVARGRNITDITDLDRLAMVGLDGMGALTYRPEEQPTPEDEIDLSWFEHLVPEIDGQVAAEDLERLRAIAGGSQGARPKFVAQLSPDGTQLRGHRVPWEPGWRPVLIKRRAINDPKGMVEAEAAYARMARAAGVEMTGVRIIRASNGEPFFVTDRFDRIGGRRLHMQTVAALLDVDFREATLDYAELLKITRVMTRDQRAVEQMFTRMVFNARAMNRDDHLKNHAFLMDATGAWQLSPAYDVSFSRGPGGEHTLLIAGEGRHPGRKQFLDVAKSAGIKPQRAGEIVVAVDDAVSTWANHADAEEVPMVLRGEITRALAQSSAW